MGHLCNMAPDWGHRAALAIRNNGLQRCKRFSRMCISAPGMFKSGEVSWLAGSSHAAHGCCSKSCSAYGCIRGYACKVYEQLFPYCMRILLLDARYCSGMVLCIIIHRGPAAALLAHAQLRHAGQRRQDPAGLRHRQARHERVRHADVVLERIRRPRRRRGLGHGYVVHCVVVGLGGVTNSLQLGYDPANKRNSTVMQL